MSRLCSGCADTVGISMSFPSVASKSCRFESAHFFRLSLVIFTAMVLLFFAAYCIEKGRTQNQSQNLEGAEPRTQNPEPRARTYKEQNPEPENHPRSLSGFWV